MKEIRLNIPDGAIKVTVEIGEDGTAVARYEKPEVNVEEKFQPKDGDIIAFGMVLYNLSVGIFHRFADDDDTHEDYVTLSSNGIHFNEGCWVTENMRPATEAEKLRLFDALAKKGKRWNAEKKCIEDLPRWRAKANETYYFIAIDVEVMDDIEDGGCVDDACYSAGNYFKTREAAERVAKQIREIFKNSKAE